MLQAGQHESQDLLLLSLTELPTDLGEASPQLELAPNPTLASFQMSPKRNKPLPRF